MTFLCCLISTPDLDQQSLHSEPEEPYLRDLPEFPSVEEFPSIDRSLLHFPLRGPHRADGAQAAAQLEEEPLSPTSLLIQHLASPLHFVNTHFNGHGRRAGGAEGLAPVPGAGEEAGMPGEEEEAAVAQGAQRSLEALSEEIVSTAISTVVQNTLSALLRSSEASEEPSLDEFLPTETPPGALEAPTQPGDSTVNTKASTAGGLGAEEDPGEALMKESATDERIPDSTLVLAEEEDFELLDQSELELVEEVLNLSSDRQAPPSPQHQPES